MRERHDRWAVRLSCLLAALACACASPPRSDAPWGSQVPLFPNGKRLTTAVKNAALDPFVYVPAVAASLLAVDDWDEQISD